MKAFLLLALLTLAACATTSVPPVTKTPVDQDKICATNPTAAICGK